MTGGRSAWTSSGAFGRLFFSTYEGLIHALCHPEALLRPTPASFTFSSRWPAAAEAKHQSLLDAVDPCLLKREAILAMRREGLQPSPFLGKLLEAQRSFPRHLHVMQSSPLPRISHGATMKAYQLCELWKRAANAMEDRVDLLHGCCLPSSLCLN